MSVALTLESAEAYVRAYYAQCEGMRLLMIEGAHFASVDGIECVRLTAHTAWRNDADVDHWDVWIERFEGAEPYIYGEC